MIQRSLLPNQGDIISTERHFKVATETSVTLNAEQEKILMQLLEITSCASILSTVKVEYLKQVVVNNFLDLWAYCRRWWHIARIFLNV